jgi:predicted permease
VFTPDEDRPGAAPAGLVVIAHGLAARRFARPEAAIGQPLDVDGRRLSIIGVMPASFEGVMGRTAVWSPLSAARWLDGSDAEPERLTSRWFEVIARVTSDLTLDEARARFAVEARRGIEQIPNWRAMFAEPRMDLVPLADTRSVTRLTTAALILLAGSGLIMVMTVANLAGLQVARSSTRRREFGLRLALGATRGSLALFVARDAAVIVTAGLAAGLLLRGMLVSVLVSHRPTAPGFGLSIADPFTATSLALDVRVAAAMLGAAAIAWIAIVAWPALAAFHAGINAVREAARSTSGRPSRMTAARALIAVELALAAVLVIGAGLMTRSAWTLAARDHGFSPEGVVTARLALPPRGYDVASTSAFYGQLVARLRAMTGVRAAGIASCAPGAGRCRFTNVRRVDGADLQEGTHPTVGAHFMTPGLLETIGATMSAGRDFDDRDRPGGTPSAIVSEALAARLWPGRPAIGRRLSLFFANGLFTEDRGVVGVVRSIEYDAAGTPAPGDVYLPAAQAAWSGLVFVRPDGRQPNVDEVVYDAVAAIDPSVIVFDVLTMERRLAAGLGDERFVMSALAAFAGAALGVAGLGVYAIVRLSVARRRREIAIRVTIGATRLQIARDVLSTVMLPGVIGTSSGVLASYWLAEFLASLLHGVAPRDPAAFAAAAGILLSSVLAAAAGPAIRAGTADPILALKAE